MDLMNIDIAKTTRRTKEVIMNMDKVNQKVWGLSPDAVATEPTAYYIEAIKKPKSMMVELKLQYRDIQVEGTACNLDEKLTTYDKMVHCALSSIYIAGHTYSGKTTIPMSTRMIYQVMCAHLGSKPSINEIKKINASIDKMRRIFVDITPSTDLEKEKPQILKISGSMISADYIEAIVQGQKAQWWYIHTLPLLCRVAENWKQIARIPLELIDCHTHIRFTAEAGAVREYLISRIELMKRSTYKNNGILMTTMYSELLGTKTPTPKQRESIIGKSGKASRILAALKDNGYIEDYGFERGARNTIIKINISIPKGS